MSLLGWGFKGGDWSDEMFTKRMSRGKSVTSGLTLWLMELNRE